MMTLSACNLDQPEGPTSTVANVNALTGTWEANLKTLKVEGKADEFLLRDGMWRCSTCLSAMTVPANGRFHAMEGGSQFDGMSVQVVNDETVTFQYVDHGKAVMGRTLRVSQEGRVLTITTEDATSADVRAMRTVRLMNRVGAASARAHKVSGRWVPARASRYSKDALTVRFDVDGARVMSGSQGQSYTAELNGAPAVVKGGPADTTVTLRREGADGLREIYMRNGEQVAVATVVPIAPGSSIAVTNVDPRDGSKVSWSATKTTRDISLVDALAQKLRLDD